MIDSAIEAALRSHGNQPRKGTDVPYVVHPVAVGILLAKAGCRDEIIVAGILHDTLEDTSMTLDDIRGVFGGEVASLVLACSEPDKSLDWEERKAHTIEFLKTASLEVRTIACADKLHNIRTIVEEEKRVGPKIWRRFNRGKAEQEWYYKELVRVLGDREDQEPYASLFEALRKEVEDLFGASRETAGSGGVERVRE